MTRSKELCGVVLSALVVGVAACGATADTDVGGPTGKGENEIIAGVDAKSPTINAIGSLVEVYRYTSCVWGSADGGVDGSTGSGGYGGYGGYGGAAGRKSTGTVVPSTNAGLWQPGTYDTPSRLVGGSGGAGGETARGSRRPWAMGECRVPPVARSVWRVPPGAEALCRKPELAGRSRSFSTGLSAPPP